jgi:hypothetical protein
MINKEYMDKKLKEYRDTIEASLYMYNMIEPFLMEWEGKQMNKRFVTKVQASIGNDYQVYLNRSSYSTRIELVVRRGNKVLNLIVADKKDGGRFYMLDFKEKNKYVLNQSEKYQKYVEAEQYLDEWNAEYQKIVQDINMLKKKMDEHECRYLIDWSELRYI